MMFLGGLIAKPSIIINLENQQGRKNVRIKNKDNQMVKLPLYTGDDDISGIVEVRLNKSKKLEHQGIKIELVGYIEIPYDKNQSTEFYQMKRELEPIGILTEDKSFKFQFNRFEKQYESFYGLCVRLRYFLRVTLHKKYDKDQVEELDFAVYTPNQLPMDESQSTQLSEQKPLKMEVGIEECLHIEFEYNKDRYHLKDCVIGKVHFRLVRIKIKYMELAIIKKETTGNGPQTQSENETVAKYEIMDGCPTKDEIIPIRLYLSAYSDLTPTYKNQKFTVKYFLNLVLIDEDDRRYFKQQEIIIYRKK